MRHTYPLQWPIDWPKTESWNRKPGGFSVSYDEAVKHLADELERLGAESGYISTDQELRLNGTPRRDRPVFSPAAAVYFVRNGQALCIPCDRFTSPRDNIRAIGLTLEAIRRMERYGTSQMVEAALSGFAALPANASPSNSGPRAWHEVLQVSPSASPEIIRAAYRKLAGMYHPDNPTTGDHDMFLEVQKAYKEATL